MAPPTIIALKAGFLANQTRLLSQPLNPSRSWRNANEAADDGIPERQLDDALVRLNHALQQHTRRVYAPQATRHVAEQIDQLYWNAGEKVAEANREAGAEGLDAGLDMSMTPILSLRLLICSLLFSKPTRKPSTPSRLPGNGSGM